MTSFLHGRKANLAQSVKENCHPNNFGAAEISHNVPCPAHLVSSAINMLKKIVWITEAFSILRSTFEGGNVYPYSYR